MSEQTLYILKSRSTLPCFLVLVLEWDYRT